MVKIKPTYVEDIIQNYNTEKKATDEDHKIPTIIAILFIALLFGLYGIIYLIDGILPTPLNIGDEVKDNPDSFIAERAQHSLKQLTDLGPRVTGSPENEIDAVKVLLTEIAFIQKQAHFNQKIEVDVQTVSGSFNCELNNCISAYGNLQNIVVKLYSKDNSANSVLVNAHYDTVPSSPGGSDDGIHCAAMIEVLRKLSQLPDRSMHNIIFLFNGGEETPVQAAHGFITQHKWANEVKVVVNLEAAGAGGKLMLFQAGPDRRWLLNYYRKSPHFFTQAAAEEMFKAGLIPSGTDFWIFADYANAVGLDFAFIRNGYRYHTKYDNFSNIPPGSYQYAGDNELSIIGNLANAPEILNLEEQEAEKTIFYDYLGLFMVSYSQTTAVILHCVSAGLALIIAFKCFYDFELGFNKQSLMYLGIKFGALLLGWVVAALFVFVIAEIVDAFKSSLSWYGNPWIIFGLYVIPSFICCCGSIAVLNRFDKLQEHLTVSAHAQIQSYLLLLLWMVPLLTCTFLGFRFAYFIFIPVFFQTLVFATTQILCLHHTIRIWLVMHVMATIIPNIFLMYIALTALTFMVPISGRIDPHTNPEILIAALTLLFTILITTFYTPLIKLVRNSSLLLLILCAVFLVFFGLVFTPVAFPYSEDPESPAPQRFWIYHMSRTFRNEDGIYKKDAGFYLHNKDRNSPDSIKRYVEEISNIESIAEDCKSSLFCGLPLGRDGSSKPDESTWIPTEQPIFHEAINLKLNSKTAISKSVMRFDFTALGPDHMEIYISARTGSKLTAISTVAKLPNAVIWNDRPLYYITYTWGKTNTPLTFTIDIEHVQNSNEPMLDIALVGKYLHDKVNAKTPHYTQFLNQFPKWTDPVAWLAAYESWVY